MAMADDELVAAFPAWLAEDVRAVVAVMPESDSAPASPFSVVVGDETVAIPYRIHPDEPSVDVVRALTATRRAILHCLYSRHGDGVVRQRHLEHIVTCDEPWVVPFVVQLVGEYVVQIVKVIRQGLADLPSGRSAGYRLYGDFVTRNPEFFTLTEYRAVTYWSYHYRWKFPVFGAYPGCQVLELLRAAASDRAGRRWPRHTPAGFGRMVRAEDV
ncbi:hypothetical protein [Streptantibioticus cattleyicolor]|uniref:Uncharacterized protein n=1 Tax=Streptantibioticus cattleyicolor (strain ATCC 35852 / DSM 46488 / JCM 4925 / NBRC 14057 / NRRL 8057) TaxID=1003195 RepID=F8JL72_STREN|nr:hypothetical protein [Streptantibioticus cattleyicolor]AEW98346.1 hypothetical protein SCATT_p01530 [Streptantibioticus cattleyicolor NRRL 8057 = DSM 46488]CCB72595.1 conserved protein of unknown function [Streptantibioticus cattleyicolor NRRL 8057 = DSM 46488]